MRTVRATVSWSSGVISPSMAVQRMRSWASAAHTSHAALAKKCPDGTCSRPAPSFRSRMASSTVACARWNASTSTASPSRSVTKAKCRHCGPQRRLATDEPGAAHDESPALVVALGHLGLAVGGVVDRGPGRLVDARDRSGHGLHHPHAHRVADVQALEGGDGGVRPEARVEAHDELPGGSGPAHPGHELLHEAHRPALGVGRALAHPDVEHLAGARPAWRGSGGSRASSCIRSRRRAWPCRTPRRWWSRGR